ncbi:MAG: peptide deformylase [Bacillota bacterium]|nr:peptide deformylase [Bacillota bacterium]
MTVRKLHYNDDIALHQRCEPVETIDDTIRETLRDMVDTMYHEDNGAGLAACQIGVMKRLVVIDMGEGLIQLVNPQIVETHGARQCMEGCLSFPDLVGKTIRPQKVKVEALNEQGEPITLWGEDDLAMCFCHEIDHLDGIVYLDRATELYRIVMPEKDTN